MYINVQNKQIRHAGDSRKDRGGDAAGLATALAKGTMLNLNADEFRALCRDEKRPFLIPLFAEIPLPPLSAADLYETGKAGPSFILESVEGSRKIARYSCIGFDPILSLSVGSPLKISGDEPLVSLARESSEKNPVAMIRNIIRKIPVAKIPAPKFSGGLVGYFSYDLIRHIHPVHLSPDASRLSPVSPLARFLLARDCIVFDHIRQKLFVVENVVLTEEDEPLRQYEQAHSVIERRIREIQEVSERKPAPGPGEVQRPPVAEVAPVISNISREAFMDMVRKTKEYIAAGDIFQAVISRRLECAISCDPFSIYRELRRINPSPYLYYINFGDRQVIGASPEMLVRVENGVVTTVPIAGTRPRGKTPAEDEALAEELLSDPKERAEHTMLVDLARNDIGRVSRFGTVRVSDFMSVEKFSHVQHIVSTVDGDLDPARDPFDAFVSCFPAGTVSGAPKIRAMQIVDELEPSARGLYAGAVGYAGFDQTLEFAIAIRTMEVSGGRAAIQVGAGIVADSVPENEWEETGSKGRAMLTAIASAERSK